MQLRVHFSFIIKILANINIEHLKVRWYSLFQCHERLMWKYFKKESIFQG